MSAITDIYQPIEHKMQIARQCLQVLKLISWAARNNHDQKCPGATRRTDLWQQLAAKTPDA